MMKIVVLAAVMCYFGGDAVSEEDFVHPAVQQRMRDYNERRKNNPAYQKTDEQDSGALGNALQNALNNGDKRRRREETTDDYRPKWIDAEGLPDNRMGHQFDLKHWKFINEEKKGKGDPAYMVVTGSSGSNKAMETALEAAIKEAESQKSGGESFHKT